MNRLAVSIVYSPVVSVEQSYHVIMWKGERLVMLGAHDTLSARGLATWKLSLFPPALIERLDAFLKKGEERAAKEIAEGNSPSVFARVISVWRDDFDDFHLGATGGRSTVIPWCAELRWAMHPAMAQVYHRYFPDESEKTAPVLTAEMLVYAPVAQEAS